MFDTEDARVEQQIAQRQRKFYSLYEVGEDFDAEAKKQRLCLLLDMDYIKSIYGSTASRLSVASSSKPHQVTKSLSIAAKRTETFAQLGGQTGLN